MADKKQSKGEKTVVTRIKANDSTPPKKPSKDTVAGAPASTENTKWKREKSFKQPKTSEVAKQKEKKTRKKSGKNPLAAFIGYFKGAWYELKQVRWPTRRSTWSMTGAVLIFTAVMSLLILLLDAGFQLLFDQII